MNSFHDNIMYRKRERTQNWSLEEKLYLLELVKSRLDVLENKRIDSASSAMKGLAWQDIHAGFAARFGSDRDAHRVREQWRRMKGQSRTEMLEFAERVRTFGAEVANQRRPSALAEEVWKTLELARRLNAFHQQSFGAGDDVGSPVNLDEDEEDAEDTIEQTDGYNHPAGDRSVNGFSVAKHETSTDPHPLDASRRSDRVLEDGAPSGHPRSLLGTNKEAIDASDLDDDAVDRRVNSSGAGLMNMLRPKVELELNDVPDLDTSMVPSGLSITAVKLGGGMGPASKRRALERSDATIRSSSWSSPLASLQMPSTASSSATGGGGSLLESKRLEHRRRLEMMEEEHRVRMELLRLEKQTAEIRRRIAASDEAAALTCRTCGAVMREDPSAVKRSAISTSGSHPDPDPDPEADVDMDASSVVTAASDVSRGSSSALGPGPLLNGVGEEDDNNNQA